MRGIVGEEKALLIRIGESIDGAINNRGPTNPFERTAKFRDDPRLPAPGPITAKEGVRTVQLEWKPVDSSRLFYYRIEITSFTTGQTDIEIAFTSNFTFKGDSGSYKALVRSIGRNGTASRGSVVFFVIQDNVMLLEGTKNGNETVGTLIFESILVPEGYQAHVWVSMVLNTFADPASGQNRIPTVQLSRVVTEQVAGLTASEGLAQATLLQEISIFPESETSTNYLDSSGAFLSPILRPVGATRTGSFETTETINFDAFTVPDEEAGKEHTFFINVINRETTSEPNTDIVSLSLVIWVASEGVSTFIPGDINVTPAGIHNTCLKFNSPGPDNEKLKSLDDQLWAFADEYSIGIWVKKLETTSVLTAILRLEEAVGGGPFPGRITIHTTSDTGPRPAEIRFELRGAPPTGGRAVETQDSTNDGLPLGEWMYYVWSFKAPGNTAAGENTVHRNGAFQTEAQLVRGPSDKDTTPTNSARTLAIGGPTTTGPAFAPVRVYQTQIWRRQLATAEVVSLYNGGDPRSLDLTVNFGGYTGASDLVHWYKHGFDQAELGEDSTVIISPIDIFAQAENIEAIDNIVLDSPS